jgi:hypothetical protein
MALSGDDFRLVFWIAILPAFIAIGVLLWGINEIPPAQAEKPRIQISELAKFGSLSGFRVSTVPWAARRERKDCIRRDVLARWKRCELLLRVRTFPWTVDVSLN